MNKLVTCPGCAGTRTAADRWLILTTPEPSDWWYKNQKGLHFMLQISNVWRQKNCRQGNLKTRFDWSILSSAALHQTTNDKDRQKNGIIQQKSRASDYTSVEWIAFSQVSQEPWIRLGQTVNTEAFRRRDRMSHKRCSCKSKAISHHSVRWFIKGFNMLKITMTYYIFNP